MSLNLNWDRPITRSAKNRLNRKISERDNTGMITILSEYPSILFEHMPMQPKFFNVIVSKGLINVLSVIISWISTETLADRLVEDTNNNPFHYASDTDLRTINVLLRKFLNAPMDLDIANLNYLLEMQTNDTYLTPLYKVFSELREKYVEYNNNTRTQALKDEISTEYTNVLEYFDLDDGKKFLEYSIDAAVKVAEERDDNERIEDIRTLEWTLRMVETNVLPLYSDQSQNLSRLVSDTLDEYMEDQTTYSEDEREYDRGGGEEEDSQPNPCDPEDDFYKNNEEYYWDKYANCTDSGTRGEWVYCVNEGCPQYTSGQRIYEGDIVKGPNSDDYYEVISMQQYIYNGNDSYAVQIQLLRESMDDLATFDESDLTFITRIKPKFKEGDNLIWYTGQLEKVDVVAEPIWNNQRWVYTVNVTDSNSRDYGQNTVSEFELRRPAMQYTTGQIIREGDIVRFQIPGDTDLYRVWRTFNNDTDGNNRFQVEKVSDGSRADMLLKPPDVVFVRRSDDETKEEEWVTGESPRSVTPPQDILQYPDGNRVEINDYIKLQAAVPYMYDLMWLGVDVRVVGLSFGRIRVTKFVEGDYETNEDRIRTVAVDIDKVERLVRRAPNEVSRSLSAEMEDAVPKYAGTDQEIKKGDVVKYKTSYNPPDLSTVRNFLDNKKLELEWVGKKGVQGMSNVPIDAIDFVRKRYTYFVDGRVIELGDVVEFEDHRKKMARGYISKILPNEPGQTDKKIIIRYELGTNYTSETGTEEMKFEYDLVNGMSIMESQKVKFKERGAIYWDEDQRGIQMRVGDQVKLQIGRDRERTIKEIVDTYHKRKIYVNERWLHNDNNLNEVGIYDMQELVFVKRGFIYRTGEKPQLGDIIESYLYRGEREITKIDKEKLEITYVYEDYNKRKADVSIAIHHATFIRRGPPRYESNSLLVKVGDRVKASINRAEMFAGVVHIYKNDGEEGDQNIKIQFTNQIGKTETRFVNVKDLTYLSREPTYETGEGIRVGDLIEHKSPLIAGLGSAPENKYMVVEEYVDKVKKVQAKDFTGKYIRLPLSDFRTKVKFHRRPLRYISRQLIQWGDEVEIDNKVYRVKGLSIVDRLNGTITVYGSKTPIKVSDIKEENIYGQQIRYPYNQNSRSGDNLVKEFDRVSLNWEGKRVWGYLKKLIQPDNEFKSLYNDVQVITKKKGSVDIYFRYDTSIIQKSYQVLFKTFLQVMGKEESRNKKGAMLFKQLGIKYEGRGIQYNDNILVEMYDEVRLMATNKRYKIIDISLDGIISITNKEGDFKQLTQNELELLERMHIQAKLDTYYDFRTFMDSRFDFPDTQVHLHDPTVKPPPPNFSETTQNLKELEDDFKRLGMGAVFAGKKGGKLTARMLTPPTREEYKRRYEMSYGCNTFDNTGDRIYPVKVAIYGSTEDKKIYDGTKDGILFIFCAKELRKLLRRSRNNPLTNRRIYGISFITQKEADQQTVLLVEEKQKEEALLKKLKPKQISMKDKILNMQIKSLKNLVQDAKDKISGKKTLGENDTMQSLVEMLPQWEAKLKSKIDQLEDPYLELTEMEKQLSELRNQKTEVEGIVQRIENGDMQISDQQSWYWESLNNSFNSSDRNRNPIYMMEDRIKRTREKIEEEARKKKKRSDSSDNNNNLSKKERKSFKFKF